MNTRTRPERNLEKLEHEPEKCDWKTTDTQKMRSISGPNENSQKASIRSISGPNENSQKASISVYVLAANSQDEVIISAPNENSQKASKSVNVLAAGSQDRICVNEHQN